MRPRRVAQAAKAAAAARLAQQVAQAAPPPAPPRAAPLLWARLALCTGAALALALLLSPPIANDPTWRGWILQAMEHAIGGDPRLVVGVDTPYGAVLDNPFPPTAWDLLATAWTTFGAAALAVLAATALALATFGWGLAARGALAGAMAAATALLVFDAGARPMDALAFGLLGMGLCTARHNHPVVQILAGPFWAAAAALAPGWAACVPLLVVATSHGRGFEARATLAISLFASAALLGGDTWLVQAWMLAAVVPLLHGLPMGPKARGGAVLASATLATGATLVSYVHTAYSGAAFTPVGLGAAGAVALALAGLAWRGWKTQGAHIPTVPALLAAALAMIGLTAQTAQPDLRPIAADTATTQACMATPQDLDDALDWMKDAGVRRLAAPDTLAWALLARDGERARQGNGTGLTVVDAGLGKGTEASRAARDNTVILTAAQQGTLPLDVDSNVLNGGGNSEPGKADAPQANTGPNLDTDRNGETRTDAPTGMKPENGGRGEGELASWKRSLGAVVLCGEAQEGDAWTQVGGMQIALVKR